MMTHEKPALWWLFFFVPAILALSLFLFYHTLQSKSAPKEPKLINAKFYKVETARGQTLENKSIVGNCHLCHAYWVAIPKTNQTSIPRFAHAGIQLKHGENGRCYNCHQITDRNNYVADDGSDIMVQLPEKLCARCHGLIYKDWQLGTHGKWTGMWQAQKNGDRKTYTCTQCHDPHDPKFKYNTIAPAPVWPPKYIRTKLEHGPVGPASQYLIEDEPKEIF